MVCLDTTFLIDVGRNRADARRKLREFAETGEGVSTTVVTMGELYAGAWLRASAMEELQRVDDLLSGFVVWEMNAASAREYGPLKAFLRRRGADIGERDLFIAAIALAHGENRIVTRNRKDFERIPGIQVVAY
ncbi:MAG: type II toxin-antitoxin system VapC family toxin [Euryarchaeota archaeon]|nr:type II toxin-antitoxin system VapC family toxin [Euryarchaeota archaeon]